MTISQKSLYPTYNFRKILFIVVTDLLSITIMMGIYQIKNTKSDTVYIGSSNNIEHRLKVHKRNLIRNKHINRHLQNAWNKYGAATFIFESIEEVMDTAGLLGRESYYINKTIKNQYNFSTCPTAPMLGKHLTREQRNKIGNAHRGKVVSAETRKKISNNRAGKLLSTEHKWNIFYSTWKSKSRLTIKQINNILENEKKEYLTVMSLSKEYKISFIKMWNILNDKLIHSDQQKLIDRYNNRKESYLSLAKKYGVTSDSIQNVVNNKERYMLLLQKELLDDRH